MTKSPPILVFSDLDGTLLDHDTYSWDAAKPALAKLQDMRAGVVLASSKTAAEIAELQDAIGLTEWPAIVENGAGLLDRNAPADTSAYDTIRAALSGAPHRDSYRGFGDLTAQGVADVTGLPLPQATLAKKRAFSEPGTWSGTPAARDAFLAYLEARGITAREGGRFLTLSLGRTKADAMAEVIARYQPKITIALGDAPNDIEMLEAADHGVIIANPHRPPLATLRGEATGQIIRSTLPGPAGWNAAIKIHLSNLH